MVGLASAGWALGGPVGSPADEPAHIVYAWSVYHTQPRTPTEQIPVPQWVADVNRMPGVCVLDGANLCDPYTDTSEAPTTTYTTAAGYPTLYYRLVGWPALFLVGPTAITAMRLVSVALSVGILALGFLPFRRQVPPWLVAAAFVAFTPTVPLFVGAVNPAGAEIVAALALGVLLVGVALRPEVVRPRTAVLSVAVLGAYLLNARPASVFWAFVVLVALGPVVMARWWPLVRAAGWWSVGAVTTGAVAAGYALWWYAGPAAVAMDQAEQRKIPNFAVYATPAPAEGWVATWGRQLSENALNWFGKYGWTEWDPPSSVKLAWFALALAMVVAGFHLVPRVARLSMLGVFVVAFTSPIWLSLLRYPSGIGYQARYVLPLVVLLPVLAAYGLDRGVPTAGAVARTALGRLVALPALFHGFLVVYMLGRYAFGLPWWRNGQLLPPLVDRLADVLDGGRRPVLALVLAVGAAATGVVAARAFRSAVTPDVIGAAEAAVEPVGPESARLASP